MKAGYFRDDNNQALEPGRYASFTQSYTHIERVIRSDVNIINAIQVHRDIPYSENDFESFHCRAIWDTGANNTVITQKVVEALKLLTFGKVEVSTAGGLIEATTHVIDLWLPNNVSIDNLSVLTGVVTDECDVLIGMDVITLGDFCITNYQRKTMFSFGMPSREVIDLGSPRTPAESDKVGRNSPCPCGSGKKYKHCHGKDK